MVKTLNILWLDDKREPNFYIYKKKSNSNAFLRNKAFYNDLLSKYNANFIWVKNFEEFKNFILTNGIPDFVSFDRDLGTKPITGMDCAKWLVSFCKEHNLKFPNYFVHSANVENGQKAINDMLKNNITEQKIQITKNDLLEMVKSVLTILREDAYIDNINSKKKEANITYQKGNSNYKKKVSGDYLGTSKMEQLDRYTYEVPLKGGIMSYNITDINGTEVMHYFKNKFDKHATTISVKDKLTGNKEDYKLKMEDNEFNQFLNTFFQKVNKVIEYGIKSFGNPELEKVSIYPVPSSSNFNQKMAEQMVKFNFANVKGGTQIINSELFKKDLKNIEIDTDFINKNKEYYESPLYKDIPKGETHLNSVNTTFNKFKKMSQYIDLYVNYINRLVKRIMTNVYTNRSIEKQKNNGNEFSKNLGKTLAPLYYQLANAYDEILINSEYMDDYTKMKKVIYRDDQVKPIKYAKVPSNIENTKLVRNLVKPYLTGVKTTCGNPVLNVNFQIRPVENRFSMKSLTNDIRLGLMGYFSKNSEIVQQELDKIKNTVFVIFDDNISGGATLSDICLQAKKLGINYIIPITFGKMRESYNKSASVTITKPENDFNY